MRYNEGDMNNNNESITSSHQKGKIDLSRLEPKPSFTIQGGLIRGYMPGEPPRTEHTRGRVCGTSRKSRKRLKDKLATVELSHYKHGVNFLTLTFSDPVPGVKEQKRMLAAYRRWLLRRYGRLAVVWRWEEGKKNGRPHYHLVIFSSKFIDKKEYAKAWGRLNGGFVDIEHVPCDRAQRYITKYISKAAGNDHETTDKKGVFSAENERASSPAGNTPIVDLTNSHKRPDIENNQVKEPWTGRTWGIWNESNLKRSEAVHVDFINTADYEKFQTRLKRIIRGWMKAERKRVVMYGFGKNRCPEKLSMDMEKELYKAWRLYRDQGKIPCMVDPGTLWKLFGPKKDYWLKHRGSWSCYVPQTEAFQRALWDCVVLLNHEVYMENHYAGKSGFEMEKVRSVG